MSHMRLLASPSKPDICYVSQLTSCKIWLAWACEQMREGGVGEIVNVALLFYSSLSLLFLLKLRCYIIPQIQLCYVAKYKIRTSAVPLQCPLHPPSSQGNWSLLWFLPMRADGISNPHPTPWWRKLCFFDQPKSISLPSHATSTSAQTSNDNGTVCWRGKKSLHKQMLLNYQMGLWAQWNQMELSQGGIQKGLKFSNYTSWHHSQLTHYTCSAHTTYTIL